MRLAIVIISLAAIAVTLIHIRRMELGARHEIEQLKMQQVSLRRTMADQDVRKSHLLAPEGIDSRREALSLDLVPSDPSKRRVATGLASGQWNR